MRRASLVALAVISCIASATTLAQQTDQPHHVNINRQPLGSALGQLSQQTGVQIAGFADAGNVSAQVGPLEGDFTVQQVLERWLQPNGLGYKVISPNMIAVVPEAARGATPGLVPTAATVTAAPQRAAAPAAAAPADEPTLSEVVVTGSNLPRGDVAALPVSVLDESAMLARDASTPAALLNSLPQVPNAPLNETANASFAARGDFAAINLRGIGTGNTLVLLNGRRLAPHPISTTDEGGLPASSVNINQLPSHGLDRIEILRDGASSVYGTDAVAGVVNYIVKKNLTGLEATLRATANEHGDGRELEASLTGGMDFAGGRGHLVSTFGVYDRDPIFLRDRSFSKDGIHTDVAPAPWNVASTLIPLSANRFYGRQSTGAYPSFRVGTSTTARYLSPQADGSVLLTTTAPVRGVNDAYFFNLNEYQAIQPSSTRINWFNQAEFELSPEVTAFGEASWYRAESTLIRQPVAYNSGNFTDKAIVVPATSPFNPFGQPVTLISKYLTDIGPESDHITDNVYRVLGGLRGKIHDSWNWETAAYYTHAKVEDVASNTVRESLFTKAIQDGLYNPFGYTFTNTGGVIAVGQPYVNPASASASFIDDFVRVGRSSLASVDAHLSGDVFDTWAGSMSAAFGAEFRRESFDFYLPPYAGLNPAGSGLATDDNDFLLSGPAENWSANRKVSSAYAEFVLPLASPANGIPLLHSLELTGSIRHEHYNDFGSTTKPKVGVSMRPVSWVMLRGSYNEGFRAPNLPVLNGGERKTLQSFLDPLLNTTAPHWGIFAGNPDLKPETSRGRTVGIVLDPPFVDGLSLTADYWEISQRNLITTATISNIMLSDAALLAPIVAANPGVPFAQLNFGSGTSSYRGDPRVIRSSDNTVYGVRTPPFNSARSFISGMDFSLTYSLPELPIGKFQLRSDWARLNSYYQYATTTALKDDKLGRDGAARWRGNVALSWKLDNWQAGVSAYYVGKFQDSNQTLPVATTAQQAQSEALYQSLQASYIVKVTNLGQVAYRYVVGSTLTYNAYVGFDFRDSSVSWLKDSRVRLGVVNATDVKPPLAAGFTGYSTNVYTSLVPGRTYTLDITRKF